MLVDAKVVEAVLAHGSLCKHFNDSVGVRFMDQPVDDEGFGQFGKRLVWSACRCYISDGWQVDICWGFPEVVDVLYW